MIDSGATFSRGAKTRATPPKFTTKKICPGQDPSGCVTTAVTHTLQKTFNLVSELRKRWLRPASKTADFMNTYNLQNKVR